MTTLIGPADFGRPATPAEAATFHALLPWVQAARLHAYLEAQRELQRRERARLRREARRGMAR